MKASKTYREFCYMMADFQLLIFRMTGHVGFFLRMKWIARGRRMQELLNMQHKTDIVYPL